MISKLKFYVGCFVAVVGLSLMVLMQGMAQSTSLPELGDADTRFLDAQGEEQIGKQFLRQLLRHENYIADPELKHYLNTLGRRIGRYADMRGMTLHFNLIAENELNAFAVPGGYITFHSGLLLATESESELASVVGHEIAHLSQRHLPRMIAKAEATKLPTTLAIISSILLGGQAGVAGVTLASANSVANQLEYSREFEREADAIGLQLMAQSEFDPQGMSTFFTKLQRFSLVTSKDVPEFLRSHPLSYNRVAAAESRLDRLTAKKHQSSFAFHLARAKIQAIYAGRAEDAVKTLQDQATGQPGEIADAGRYGLALAQLRLREYDLARETLAPLLEKHPNLIATQIAQGEIERESGDTAAAAARYRQLVESAPEAVYLNYYYIQALLDNDDAKGAKKVARYQLRRNPDEYELYQSLSKANVKLGDLAEAHQADGEYAAALGAYSSAIAAFKLALRDNADGSEYLTQSIVARITALERKKAGIEKS